MYLFVNILLLATCCCACKAANLFSKRVARDLQQQPEVSTATAQAAALTAALNLPRGFKPQPPPAKPMLYPFATAAPESSAGWRPMVMYNGPITTTSYIPLLQERTDEADPSPPLEEGPVFESVVYGAWKSERPLQPEQIYKTSGSSSSSNSKEYATRSETELLGHAHPITESETPSASQTPLPIPSDTSVQPVLSVNMSDPHLLEMVKQINDSAETVTFYNRKTIETLANSTWPTTTITNANEQQQQQLDSKKIWPTDFLASAEHSTISTKINYNYLGDSSDPPQALANIPDELLPRVAFNITKMGKPYEQQNAIGGRTICVPLTVREQLTTGEELEIERVYCFPLPKTETELDIQDTMAIVVHDDYVTTMPTPVYSSSSRPSGRLSISTFALLCLISSWLIGV